MKIKVTLVFVCLVQVFSLWAQSPISMTQADMPTVGFTESYAKDTPTTSVNYGSPGANQVYDFSALTSTYTQGVNYLAPTPAQQTAFPSANLALTSDGSSYILLKSSAAKYQAVGLSGYDYGLLVNTPLQPVEDLFHFPTQYLQSYASYDGFYQGFTGSQVNAPSGVDSVREVFTDHFSLTADGWGKVITPVGSYRALRIKRVDTTVTEIDAYYGLFSSSWHVVSGYPITEITTEYSYVAKETKGAVVSFNYDSAGDMLDAQYSLIPPAPPVAGFTDAQGSAGLNTFTDTSEGYPTRYSWNFGDGDTSNLANPTHTYAANGTYYVCETIWNPSGSNTYCDSVHVTSIIVHLPPVANNDFATVQQPHGDTINVTANDNSPSSDPFCVTSIYGGTYFSVLGCNNVAFNPPGGFSGYDTCHYVVCNTNEPTMCDTALVIVDVVIGVVHYPPVAGNDTAIDIENHIDVIPVTVNDHSPSNDTFCITSVYGSSYFSVVGCSNLTFNPPVNFVGYDTCYYIVCNTGEPALCDTARVIVDVVLPHLPPVATNDTAIDLENHSDLINVTSNDHSPTSDSFCITRVYGSSYFTVSGCNDLNFTPANNFVGYDTCYYIECNTGQPTLCDTGRVIVDVVPHHVPPVAVNDGAVFLQPAANVIHATLNDYSPSADSFCITTVYGGVPGASVLNCGNISFNPDSAFTGNDSIFYVICNTNQPTLCDTGLVVVTVDPNPLLAPITNFNIYPMECQGVITVNQSSNADSVVWSFKPIWNNFYADSNFSQQDTAQYGFRTNGLYLQVCLTSFNRFGSSVKCDSLETACLGIDEIQLSGVRMYPNPASNILTIDLRANRAAVSEYSSIIIYNAIGQKIIALNKNSQVDLLEIPVENLQAGIYLATIVTVDGTSSVLGNFTVIK